jgi:outer membrane protein assembly factor BamB
MNQTKRVYASTRAALAVLAVCFAAHPTPAQQADDHQREIEQFYARWIGVEAPEFRDLVRDRTNGPRVLLKPLRGKRVLLLSFEAGDFNRAADEKSVVETLRAVDRAMTDQGRDKLAVVGFTAGTGFIMPGAPRGEYGELSRSPIVSIITGAPVLGEPYNLLLGPGAILIDSKGIVRAIQLRPLSAADIAKMSALGDWDQAVRPAPVEDPWMGKGPPKPARQLARKWSKPISSIIALCAGDWDLSGEIVTIAVTPREIVLMRSDDGEVKRKIAVQGVELPDPSVKIEGFSMPYTVDARWAEIKKGKTALFLFTGGWPETIPVLGQDGAVLWEYSGQNGADCAAWVDLLGKGEKSLLVGYNFSGLHAVDPTGHALWKVNTRDNCWCVSGIDASGGGPGLALYTARGKVHIADARGQGTRELPSDDHEVHQFAASELDDAGTRQVVAVWPARVGSLDYAVATDLQGKVLWKYPVNQIRIMMQPRPIDTVDLGGDGKREWVIATGRGEFAVLDAAGRLIAQLKATGKRWYTWTVAPCRGKPGSLVVAGDKEVEALALEP